MEVSSYLQKIYHNKFHALTHKDFRIYWLGQCVSTMGTWMQTIGLTWLVYSATGSPVLLGLMETARFLPVTVFSLLAGVIIDRYSKRRILIITQSISMLVAFTLSVLVFMSRIWYGDILLLALILGFANTIDAPARQAFTVEITGKEDLPNAIALSSVTFNLARIIGPAVGALVLAYFGAGWCFLLNGLSFLAVIASLIRIKVRPGINEKCKKINIFKEIKDGLKYIIEEKNLLHITLLIIVVGIFVYNYDILIPIFTKKVLYQNEKVYGLLMSSLGIGSLLGALMVSLKGKSGSAMNILTGSAFIEAVLLILIAITRTYNLAIIFLAVSGIFNIWFSTAANSALQLTTKDEYRGRVMSVYSLVYSGTAPIGYMFAGSAAGRFGADAAFAISGAATIILIALLSLFFYIKRIR